MSNKSGYKGVSFDDRRSMFRAVGNKPWRHIGYYHNEEQAARAYDLDLKSHGIVDPAEYNFPEYILPRTQMVYLVMPDKKIMLVQCPKIHPQLMYEFARRQVGITDPAIVTPWSEVHFTDGVASLSWFV